jgi:hypothetical protein
MTPQRSCVHTFDFHSMTWANWFVSERLLKKVQDSFHFHHTAHSGSQGLVQP